MLGTIKDGLVLVLRDPQELRDTTLVVAGEGERIWNSVSDLHLRMI